MKTRLYIFDFDGTLMRSPEPEEGKALYERTFGTPYPHKGWWSKPESLHKDFDIQPNQAVVEYYKKAQEEGSRTILMTNRLKRLEDLVFHHLERHGMVDFDAESFGDSYKDRKTKPQRLGHYLETYRHLGEPIEEVIVLDDMEDQLADYIKMREDWKLWGSPVSVKILQVTKPDGGIVER